ncbi:MAG: hypothetical protein RIC55_21940 [Pirellulaceae bacterium]
MSELLVEALRPALPKPSGPQMTQIAADDFEAPANSFFDHLPRQEEVTKSILKYPRC